MEINEKIMVLRKRKGYSQEDLAHELDVSRQAVYKWESGESTPELDKIKKSRCISEPLFRIELEKNNLNMDEVKLNEIVSETAIDKARYIKMLREHLEALNPKAVLKRGYSIVYKENGRVVSKASDVNTGEKINIQTGDGVFTAEKIMINGR